MDAARAVLLSRVANLLALVALLLVLTGSLYLQFVIGEQPCPLCLAQRSGMIGLAVGPLLNVLWGIKARNYALAILAAFAGGVGSARQIFLHIANNQDPGYGPAVFGLHLYTWAGITFAIGVVGCALLLMWQTPLTCGDRGVLGDRGRTPAALVVAAVGLFVWIGAYLLAITVSAIPECGLGLCPDDPADINGISPTLFGIVLALIIAVGLAVGVAVARRLRASAEDSVGGA